MADKKYEIPEEPQYSEDIREMQDTDPASASNTFNPLILRILENIAALKRLWDRGGAKGDKGDTGEKGDTGAPGGFGTPTATVDANTGTPSVTVTASGPDSAKVFTFVFKNLKGQKGDTGDTGATPALNDTVNSTSTTQAATANAVRLAYELANGKQSKPVKGSFTIPTTGWGTDSTTGYTKYYDVTVSGVTANDRADIIIAPGSVNAAAACGMCPVSETLAGKVRIRASKVPTAAISAEYWIEKE